METETVLLPVAVATTTSMSSAPGLACSGELAAV
jgi:hypothetical protein